MLCSVDHMSYEHKMCKIQNRQVMFRALIYLTYQVGIQCICGKQQVRQ